MLSDCGTCGSDRLVKVELARTLMNCVIAWRWGQDWSADNVSCGGEEGIRSVEGRNFKLWIEEHGLARHYYFSYVKLTCYIYG